MIELKRGRTGDRVVAQIARYMTWVVRRLCSGRARNVRGVIVGKEFDAKFEAALAQLKRAVASYTYDVRLAVRPWAGPTATRHQGRTANAKPHRPGKHDRES